MDNPLVVKIPTVTKNLQEDCIVFFGNSGYSDWFYADIKKDSDLKNLVLHCHDKMEKLDLPPPSKKLMFVKIYRFEKILKYNSEDKNERI